MTNGFELEEALYSTAPIGLHCISPTGQLLYANQTELNVLGYSKEEYVGQYVCNFVYSDKQQEQHHHLPSVEHHDQQQQPLSTSTTTPATTTRGGGGDTSSSHQQQTTTTTTTTTNLLITADDKTLYTEILKRVTSGNPIKEIPVRFISRSGTIIHLLLDCDGIAVKLLHNNDADDVSNSSNSNSRYYYRFFTRDDTTRRIQEMRSNVLFQETNRSLQMLDNFMNRSMQQMRAPLTLLESACNLVTENIEDIEEVIRRNNNNVAVAAAGTTGGGSLMMMMNQMNNISLPLGGGGDPNNSNAAMASRRSFDNLNTASQQGAVEDDAKPHALNSTPTIMNDFSTNNFSSLCAPLTVALSATLEARSVVGLATTLTKDALALVDDITDLCRFDQGRVLLIEKEAVKVRDICLEALIKVPIPVGTGGLVDVVLDIQEGTPGRAMTDKCVLQRSLALLLNFAVDAAANAVKTGTQQQQQQRGKVILSVQDAGGSACKISVYYTNPPEATDESMNIMGATNAAMGGPGGSNAATLDATSFASAYTSSGNQQHTLNSPQPNMASANNDVGGGIIRGNSFPNLPSIFGECYSKPNSNNHDNEDSQLIQNLHHTPQGVGSMMRRIRLRESIEGGMTSCRRDKLGLGLSLLYHLVGAQGSDLRYEIVTEQPSQTIQRNRVVLPSMTKFWFLLPMSLDFPDRLPAEHIVKDVESQAGVTHHPQGGPLASLPVPLPTSANARTASSLISSFAVASDDGAAAGLGGMQQQQPLQKRARISSQQQQQQNHVPADPLNSILNANVIGNTSLLSNHPELTSATLASAGSASSSANNNSMPSKTTKAAGSASVTTSTTPKYPGVAPGARPLVLVVDDTDVSASLLCMHLRKLNCSSHRAENGEVAIEMLRSAPSPNMYSLILMDLRMPVVDGFEATKIIKGSNASHIPVVALTGETSEENRQRCREIGFDDYKTKPLKRPQLKELLNKFVPGYTSVD